MMKQWKINKKIFYALNPSTIMMHNHQSFFLIEYIDLKIDEKFYVSVSLKRTINQLAYLFEVFVLFQPISQEIMKVRNNENPD